MTTTKIPFGEINMIIGTNEEKNECFVFFEDSKTKEELECCYWDKEEFKENASNVLGAIFGVISLEGEQSKNINDKGIYVSFPSFEEEEIIKNFYVETAEGFVDFDVKNFELNPTSNLVSLSKVLSPLAI